MSREKKALSSLLWKFSERMSVQVINLIIQIFLTRLLLPKDFAVVAIIMVFVQLANIIVQGGFGSALVQKENVDSKDYSSVFYLCLVISIILYIVLFIGATPISRFYQIDILKKILRVQALILFPCAFNTVQIAFLSKNMQFRENFKASFIACFIAGIISVVAAQNGFGVWAIVLFNVSNQIILTVALWIFIKWRPTLEFSLMKIKGMFSFGWKLLISSFLGMGYSNLQTLIVGKVFTQRMLGFYNRGELMGTALMNSISSSISSVMLPVFSENQSDIDKFKSMYRKTLVLDCFFSFPIMFGLASVSKSIITILFTEKWLPAVPFMIMVCLARAFDPIHITNLQGILALGRSDIALKLEIVKKGLGIFLMIVSYKYGIYAFVASGIALSIISTVINAYPNNKLIKYSFKEQIKDIIPYLSLSMIMFVVVSSMSFVKLNSWLLLFSQVVIGVLIYVIGCIVLKAEALKLVLDYIKEKRNV